MTKKERLLNIIFNPVFQDVASRAGYDYGVGYQQASEDQLREELKLIKSFIKECYDGTSLRTRY